MTGSLLAALVLLPRVQVDGPSMLPTLAPGERLLVLPRPARAGGLIVVRDPRLPSRLLVKRAQQVNARGVRVVGDNAAISSDSRTFGLVPHRGVLGRPIYRYAPAENAGWIWNA